MAKEYLWPLMAVIVLGFLYQFVLQLLSNEIYDEVEQKAFVAKRFFPYLVLVSLTGVLFFFIIRKAKKKPRQPDSIWRKYWPFLLFVWKLAEDIAVNLFANESSNEVKQMSFIAEKFLPYLVVVAVVLGCTYIIKCMAQRKKARQYEDMPTGGHVELGLNSLPGIEELNDSLYELYKPVETPTMHVIFLHGLQSEDNVDPHLSTWKSGDGSCLWPQTWLIEKFPGAQVLSVSYSAHVKKNEQGEFDIHNIGENLLSDILELNIGQAPYCPVILVGHCFGGSVIKRLCNRAYDSFTRASDLEKKLKLGRLLENIRGIYYYGTPHHGSPLMDAKNHLESNLLEYFKLLSKDGARVNAEFEQLPHIYPKWRIHGLGESRPIESGIFQGIFGAPEASSREGASFNIADADHFQICRPENKTSRSFYDLVALLESIATDVKEELAQALEEVFMRIIENY